MKLPEELLHTIIENLAPNTSFIENQLLEYRAKYSSSKLLSLSLSNHQWRRLCIPFLFSHIEIPVKDLQRLADLCDAHDNLAESVRTLNVVGVKGSQSPSEQMVEVLIRLLSHLTHLSQINLTYFALNRRLLTILRSHPVSSVVIGRIDSLTLDCIMDTTLDLSKVTVQSIVQLNDTHGPNWDSLMACIPRGLQMKELYTASNPSLLPRFDGLTHLQLFVEPFSQGLVWVPEFLAKHPCLQKIVFHNGILTCPPKSGIQADMFPFPFILPFLVELEKEQCQGCLPTIFAVTRKNSISSSARSLGMCDWQVTGLYLQVYQGTPSRTLDVAHTCFPQLSILTVHYCDSRVPIDDLFTSFPRLSSLRALNLLFTLKYLGVPNHMPLDIRERIVSEKLGPADAEACIIWYLTHMAKKMPSIEAFYVQERGPLARSLDSTSELLSPFQSWIVQGWIDAHRLRNILHNQPDMVGILNYSPHTENPKSDTAGYRFPKHANQTIFV